MNVVVPLGICFVIQQTGTLQPTIRHSYVGGEFVVPETTDLYIRRAILDGSLDYIETVHDYDAETNKGSKSFRDVELVRATVANTAARAEAAKAAKALADAAAESEAKELAELDRSAKALAGDAAKGKPPAPVVPAT